MQSLWVVTSYYNPKGCLYRLHNLARTIRGVLEAGVQFCLVEVVSAGGERPVFGSQRATKYIAVRGDGVPSRHERNEERAAHYLIWAARVRQEFSGVPGCLVDVTAQHLWHGSEASRKYHERKGLLRDFLPRDVEGIPGEGLRWVEPEDVRVGRIREGISNYFQDRANAAKKAGFVIQG
jgi:hypothetical protein